MFQHTAARRRLQLHFLSPNLDNKFQHTAARRRLPLHVKCKSGDKVVSTHSRPKAAAFQQFGKTISDGLFQHTAARRRLQRQSDELMERREVSTHSRPKAAAECISLKVIVPNDSFNTQPPEGGCKCAIILSKEQARFQHTAARRWLRFKA